MLSIITIDESEKWDKIVKSFEKHDVYYLSSYVKAFKIHGDGEPTLFYYENNKIKAINVVMKRDIGMDAKFNGKIPLNMFYDIITPYGYGGFLLDGDIKPGESICFNDEYVSYCSKNSIVSEFVRFHPVLENYKYMDNLYDIITLGNTVTIDLKSRDEIWNEITSKNRNMIRKSIKSDVNIYFGHSPELYKKFINLYNETMSRDNAADYYYFKEDFYNSILNDLKYNSLIFYATFENKIISMAIILFANKQMHYHLSASDKEYLSFAPTNYLLYHVSCWGHEQGFETLHLGGGLGGREDSLYKFKKSFNKNSDTCFAIGKKIFDENKYDYLMSIENKKADKDDMNMFFPGYRV